MEEPPGGHSHGRKRSPYGRWVPLGLNEQRAVEEELLPISPEQGPARRSVKPPDTIRHGTLSAYKNDRCRCDDCRAVNAAWVKGNRNVES